MGRRRDLSYQKKPKTQKCKLRSTRVSFLPSFLKKNKLIIRLISFLCRKTLDKKPETSVYPQNCLINTTVKT